MPRYANLLNLVLALAVGTMLSQAQARDTPSASATVAPARIDTKFLPRAPGNNAIAGTLDPAAVLYAMTHTVFEGESWGEIPELGLSVQDMTSFVGKWSGNKQIFWNSNVAASFKWDFAAPGAKSLTFDMTGAPDYGIIKIRLFCYRKTAQGYFVPMGTRERVYDGYATSVRRKTTGISLLGSPPCASADAYRLVFIFASTAADRRFGGIDRIVVAK